MIDVSLQVQRQKGASFKSNSGPSSKLGVVVLTPPQYLPRCDKPGTVGVVSSEERLRSQENDEIMILMRSLPVMGGCRLQAQLETHLAASPVRKGRLSQS